MDIDSSASTPILRVSPDLSNAQYLRYELTALAYYLKDRSGPEAGSPGPDADGFTALVIGPGGGRDLISALVFGAGRVDGVEINPIIARDVMGDRFHAFSGGIYTHPRVRIAVDDGRSFVSRTSNQYDIIQASLVDTWAATAAGAYTLTENTLYTVEAFNDYLDHLKDDGVVTITRWVFDGLRLVSLAQEACAGRGWDARSRLAIVQHDRVATFLLKKSPFTEDEIGRLRAVSDRLGFRVLYVPGMSDGRDTPRRGRRRRRLRPSDHRSRPRALLRRVRAGRPPDHRRSAVLLPHHQACRPVPGRVWAVDALRQWAERTAHADGHRGRARRALRRRSARARRRPASSVVACVPRVLRRAGRRVHAHRGRRPAAVRAPPRASGVLADRHAVLTAAWHRDWRGLESSAGWSRTGSRKRDHAGSDRAAGCHVGGDR